MLFWLALSAALAAKPYTLELTVVNEAGEPVTTAMVQVAQEGEQTHKVHGETGRWANDGLDLPSGERAPFTKGQSVAIDVWADGYARQQVEAVLAKKRTEVAVTLAAAPEAPPAAEPAPEAPAAEPAPETPAVEPAPETPPTP